MLLFNVARITNVSNKNKISQITSTKHSLEKVIKEALSNVPDTEGTKCTRLRKRKMTISPLPPLVTEGEETQPRPEERVTPGHDRWQPGFAGRALPRRPMPQERVQRRTAPLPSGAQSPRSRAEADGATRGSSVQGGRRQPGSAGRPPLR